MAFSLERCGENGGGWLEGSEVDLIFTHLHDVRSTAEVIAMENMRRKDICAVVIHCLAMHQSLPRVHSSTRPAPTSEKSNGPLSRRPLQTEFDRSLSQLEAQRDTRKRGQDPR